MNCLNCVFVHSLLLDVLCRVHAELAAIDEENEKLDSAMKHLQKALELDPDSEHLSSSLHLLQLRSSVHSAPTRPEERAAKLIQQVLHRPSPHSLNERLSCSHRQLTAEGVHSLLCCAKAARRSEKQNMMCFSKKLFLNLKVQHEMLEKQQDVTQWPKPSV